MKYLLLLLITGQLLAANYYIKSNSYIWVQEAQAIDGAETNSLKAWRDTVTNGLSGGGTDLTTVSNQFLLKSGDTAGSLTVTNLPLAQTIGCLEFSYWDGFGLLTKQLKIKNSQIGFYGPLGNLSTLHACEPTLSNHVATMHYVDNATNGLASLGQVQAMTNSCLQTSGNSKIWLTAESARTNNCIYFDGEYFVKWTRFYTNSTAAVTNEVKTKMVQ